MTITLTRADAPVLCASSLEYYAELPCPFCVARGVLRELRSFFAGIPPERVPCQHSPAYDVIAELAMAAHELLDHEPAPATGCRKCRAARDLAVRLFQRRIDGEAPTGAAPCPRHACCPRHDVGQGERTH